MLKVLMMHEELFNPNHIWVKKAWVVLGGGHLKTKFYNFEKFPKSSSETKSPNSFTQGFENLCY